MRVAVRPCGVRLVLLEHVVDSREQHSGDGNNGFLVSSALFESKIMITYFRELLDTNGTKSALNEQRFDVGTGSADFSSSRHFRCSAT